MEKGKVNLPNENTINIIRAKLSIRNNLNNRHRSPRGLTWRGETIIIIIIHFANLKAKNKRKKEKERKKNGIQTYVERMNRETENFPSFSQNGILSGSLKKKRKNRTGPVKACSSKQTIPRMVTVPLRLTIRRKHYSISCYLIGLCTLPRGLALPDCSRGIDVPELIPLPAPSPSPLLDKSTPRLSLSLSL